jgi:flavin reductase (DIM6/NTAB) family NADH-FMN oxidoreductase RutF
MPVDPQAKKVALRAINYGLSVLTANDGDEYAAAGINWISQASFEPPLIMVALKTDSDSHALVDRTGVFAVNVLGEDQLDVAKAFFRSTTVEDGTLNGYRFDAGPATGAPLLTDLAYWFEARVTDTVKRGDHTVFVAEVVEAGVRDESVTPLSLRATGMSYGG